MERYVRPYAIKEVVSLNAVKLKLPSLMRIHLVVNISWIVWYKEQVKGQKKEKGKLVEVEGVEEWEVEKILNKKKMRGVEKYLSFEKGGQLVECLSGISFKISALNCQSWAMLKVE